MPDRRPDLVDILYETTAALIRTGRSDLTARQLGIFLICYLSDASQTVRGLSAALKVPKPSITRALDKLGELDLTRRKADPLDRRGVVIERTRKGQAFLAELTKIMADAAAGYRPGARSGIG